MSVLQHSDLLVLRASCHAQRRITKTIVDTDSYPMIRLFHKVHMRFFRESEFRAPIYIFLEIKFSH